MGLKLLQKGTEGTKTAGFQNLGQDERDGQDRRGALLIKPERYDDIQKQIQVGEAAWRRDVVCDLGTTSGAPGAAGRRDRECALWLAADFVAPACATPPARQAEQKRLKAEILTS
jgi:hypothetical protein